jgi:type I restriction enzyme S subunit
MVNNNDWKETSLGEVLTLQRGFDLPHKQRQPGNVPIVSSSGISGKHSQAMVSSPGVVTGRYGTIGQVFFIDEDFWPLNTTLFVRDFKGNDPLFISFLLRTIDFQSYSGKSGVPGVNRNDLRQLMVRLPPLPEQEAIAKVLSDVDTLITALEGLIAKKRDIKQAAMQQLLTGKTRLPGFSGEWEVKKLGEIVQINMGQSPDSENYNHKGIGIPLIQGNADIENRKSIRRVWTTQVTKVCDKGDLILTVRAPVGSIGIASEYSCLGRGVCSLKPITYDIGFLFHSLVFAESHWKTLEQGSTFTSANSAQIAEFTLLVTESIKEQTSIAAVLSDMDAEIAALEQRRDKTRALKQGMMQELLTGKTRLL